MTFLILMRRVCFFRLFSAAHTRVSICSIIASAWHCCEWFTRLCAKCLTLASVRLANAFSPQFIWTMYSAWKTRPAIQKRHSRPKCLLYYHFCAYSTGMARQICLSFHMLHLLSNCRRAHALAQYYVRVRQRGFGAGTWILKCPMLLFIGKRHLQFRCILECVFHIFPFSDSQDRLADIFTACCGNFLFCPKCEWKAAISRVFLSGRCV